MIPIKTVLWYLLGFIALAVIYMKKQIIIEAIKEKIIFQQQYNQIHKEAYQEEKLKQAKIQGMVKARQPGFLSGGGLGSNLKKIAEQDIKIPKKKKGSKKKEPPKSNIEKLMRI